ncbi:MAG: type II CRISPR RNA-guided endonuclease Cas9 [Rhodospirillales bacterium]|nr:type II CRISPR RNA-guided endonuclease Cas9 [Rhodospirillales bacterium]
MTYRLGLDIGTNSIGWCILDLSDDGNPSGIRDAGVRIFSDGRNPKDRQSLAVMRRLPRQQRKRRDRYLKRRAEFMARLVEHDLMPADHTIRKALEDGDPWSLRVKGLDEKLSRHELGRALFHLQQRRGFKSNRKTDKGADDETGKIKSAAANVLEAMQETGARTLGEYLARPRIEDAKAAHTHPVRARLKGSGAQSFYTFYPLRDEMIAAEFDALWAKQKEWHGDALSEDAREAIRDTLLFQRPLRPQPVGKCSLDPTEERAPRALPSVQRFRIYQEINNLTIRLPGEAARNLTMDERDKLAEKALSQAKLTFDAARKLLKLSAEARFNLESAKRKHIDGDKTAAVLAGTNRWGPDWRTLSFEDQETIVEHLLDEEDEEALVNWLSKTFGFSLERAQGIANAPLPDSHGQLGRTATRRVLKELANTGSTYNEAVVAAGYHSHSALDFDGEIFKRLPYYGQVLERHVAFGTGKPCDRPEKRYGKVGNPTVHVALNQIRHVVNALTKKHREQPLQIVVELARDLPLSAKGKSELEKQQKDNKNANDRRREELANLSQTDSYENRLRLRLWEELNRSNCLDRRCPYTGQVISINRLFSDQVEIEHILPFSKTLDDGIGNKTLCMRQANREKGQRSPFEAFGASPEGYDWAAIAERAANFPPNKSWRFGPDAMERYQDGEQDFLSRHLNETRYIARLAKLYLHRTGADVWVTPGRLTADLRWAWGLDSVLEGHNLAEAADPEKNRKDHRHHAIDAIVVALTDRSTLKAVATAAGQAEDKFDKRLLADVPEPWPDFRETVRNAISQIIVSHKPEHGPQGSLHNDTAYGIVDGPDNKGRSTVVHRVPLETFKKWSQLEDIRDPILRKQFEAATEGLSGKDFVETLVRAGEEMTPPVRKVRICETLSVISITDSGGHPYKAYKGDSNYCYDIYADPKGRWSGTVVSRFDANQPGFNWRSKQAKTGEPLIMRLRQNDMIALDDSGNTQIMRVVKFSQGQIVLAEHFQGGALKARDADSDDPFKYKTVSPSRLQALKARAVHIDPGGVLYDVDTSP